MCFSKKKNNLKTVAWEVIFFDHKLVVELHSNNNNNKHTHDKQTSWISLQHYFSIKMGSFSAMIYNDIFLVEFSTEHIQITNNTEIFKLHALNWRYSVWSTTTGIM